MIKLVILLLFLFISFAIRLMMIDDRKIPWRN